MNIKKTSLIYKFQDNCLFGEASIPDNLCPYMRRFLKLAGLEFLFGLLALMIVQSFILFPFLLLLGIEWLEIGGYLEVVGKVGVISWVAIILGALVFTLNRLFSRQYKSRQAIDAWTVKMVAPIKEKVKSNIFVQWYNAIHDKICPALNFIDKESKA